MSMDRQVGQSRAECVEYEPGGGLGISELV